jgi:prevent-host-death family protein
MKKASITEAKNRLSALIDEVRNGDTVLILDRGRPVARLESAAAGTQGDADGRLTRLERQGLVRRSTIAPRKSLLTRTAPRVKDGASLSKVLLEERGEGR